MFDPDNPTFPFHRKTYINAFGHVIPQSIDEFCPVAYITSIIMDRSSVNRLYSSFVLFCLCSLQPSMALSDLLSQGQGIYRNSKDAIAISDCSLF
jgi:hypothetical protein